MSVRFRLSMMMFLQFFIWGAWLPLIFGYLPSLGFDGSWQQPFILNAFPIAALVALFFSTQFADRNFAAEKFVAFSHLVGGLAILGLFWAKGPVSLPTKDTPVGQLLSEPAFLMFFGLMLLHCLFYVPTISITNSIAFANLKDPQKDFGPIRLWGTIGWIAASVPFVFILVDWTKVQDALKAQEAMQSSVGLVAWIKEALNPANALTGAAFREATRYTFLASGIASLFLAVFSLTLPHTPPKPAPITGSSLAWVEALGTLLKNPFVIVLFVVTLIDATIHQTYFVWTERFLTGARDPGGANHGVGIAPNWVMPIMSIGQVAEVFTMAILGFVLKSFGWRITMIIGILGHAGRFAAFAFLPEPWLAISVNVLHGICYAFFFATVYIFVDEYFPKDIRSSAQGLFNALILGLGPIAGNFMGTYLGQWYRVSPPEAAPVYDFQKIFIVPAGLAVFAALLLLVAFWPPPKPKEELAPASSPAKSDAIRT